MDIKEKNKILEEIKKRPDVKKYRIIYLICIFLMVAMWLAMYLIKDAIAIAILMVLIIGLIVVAVSMNRRRKNLINVLISALTAEEALKTVMKDKEQKNEIFAEGNVVKEVCVDEREIENRKEERKSLANRLITISNRRNLLYICSSLTLLLGLVFLLFLPICEFLGVKYSIFNLIIDWFSKAEINILKEFIEAKSFNKISVIIFLVSVSFGVVFVLTMIIMYGKYMISGAKRIYAGIVEAENHEITINPNACSTKVDKIGCIVWFIFVIIICALYLIFPINYIINLDTKDSLTALFISVNYISIIFYSLAVIAIIVLQIYLMNAWFRQDEDDRATINGLIYSKIIKKHYK